MAERRTERAGLLALLGGHRLVIGLSALAIAAALGLLLFAWWDETVKPRTELALRVGDRSYDMEYWARRYAMANSDPASVGGQAGPEGASALPEQTTAALERDAVILERAGTLGVEAGQNEIDREMLTRLGIPVITDTPEGEQPQPNDPLRINPGMTNTIRAQLQQTGLTLAEFREIYEARLLRSKVERYFLDLAPTRAPQVRIRLLQLPSESDSRIAIQRIQSGQNRFDELADTVSLDQAGKGKGGARDWLPRGILPPALDDVAFRLPLNTLSEPIDSGLERGWFLIEVLERTDERDVTEDVRKQIARGEMNRWLDQQKSEMTIRNAVTAEKVAWARDFMNINPSLGTGLPGGQGLPIPAPQTIPLPDNPAPAAPPAPPSSP